MRKLTVFLLISLSLLFMLCDDGDLTWTGKLVRITDMGTYYRVVLDFTGGTTHYNMGVAYGGELYKVCPTFEEDCDDFLNEKINEYYYQEFLDRVEDIKPQIPQIYRDEIEGMASVITSDGDEDVLGDGKLSTNELYLVNLIPDIAHLTACSALGVYGQYAEDNRTRVARILDFHGEQLPEYNSVTTIIDGNKSICIIGYLGGVGCLTGFNDDGVFAGCLYSGTGAVYSSEGKNSYCMDMRYALENNDTLDDVALYLIDDTHQYTYNHDWIMADSETSKVLELNFSGSGSNMRRELRTASSQLNDGVEWDFTSAIACVNSFILLGNHDNHTGEPANYNRWSTFVNELEGKGDKVSLDELKDIASYDGGDGPGSQSQGDIYNQGTQQIIIYEPDTGYLECFFRQPGDLPDDPTFEVVPVDF